MRGGQTILVAQSFLKIKRKLIEPQEPLDGVNQLMLLSPDGVGLGSVHSGTILVSLQC